MKNMERDGIPMRRRKTSLAISTLTLIMALAGTGCSSLKAWWYDNEKPYRVFVYSYSWEPEEENRFNTVEYGGRTMYLDPRPIIQPKMIRKIEAYPVGKGQGLKIHLTEHGAFAWHQATALHRGKQLIYMLDNEYRGPIKIEKINPDGLITVPGPYLPEEVEKIREQVRENAKD